MTTKERSVICRPYEVRAILNSTQTQIRRPITKLNGFGKITEFQRSQTNCYDWQFRDKRALWNDIDHRRLIQCSPYGAGGDRLWVRETWAVPHRYDHLGPSNIPVDGVRVHYAATEERGGLRWRPSIHMCRWASRITLEVTGVRVERLQDISNEDIKAEGLDDDPRIVSGEIEGSMLTPFGRRIAFESLWEQINGPGSWDANPWVWVVEFRRITP